MDGGFTCIHAFYTVKISQMFETYYQSIFSTFLCTSLVIPTFDQMMKYIVYVIKYKTTNKNVIVKNRIATDCNDMEHIM